MADISKYALIFSANPGQALSAFGKVGQAAQQSANQIQSAFNSVNVKKPLAQAGQATKEFEQVAKQASFKNLATDIKGLSKQLGTATSALGGFGGALGQVGPLLANIASAGGPVGIAIVAVLALAAATLSAATRIDEMAKAARRLDLSIVQLQTLRLAAEESAVGFDELNNIFQKLGSNLADAAMGTGAAVGSLRELNLSAQDLLDLDAEQRLLAISARMQEMNLSMEDQARLWQDLGGKAAKGNFVVFAQQAALNLENARHELEMMNATISGRTGAAAEFLMDMFGRVKIILEAIGNTLVSAIGPIISQVFRYIQATWMLLAPIVDLLGQIVNLGLVPFKVGFQLVTILLRQVASLLQVIGAIIKIAFLPIEIIFRILEGVVSKLEPIFMEVEKAFMEIKKAIDDLLADPAIQQFIEDAASFIGGLLIPAIRAFATAVKWVAQQISEARRIIREMRDEIPQRASSVGRSFVQLVANPMGYLNEQYNAGMLNLQQQQLSVLQGIAPAIENSANEQTTMLQQFLSTSLGQALQNGAGILTGIFNFVALAEKGNKLVEQLGQQFNASAFVENIRALQAAMQSGTITSAQFSLSVSNQLEQLRQYVGRQAPEVGQRAMLEGSVEAVTVMLQTQYGQAPRPIEEEIRDLLAEALVIQTAQLEAAKAEASAMQNFFGPVLAPLPLNLPG